MKRDLREIPFRVIIHLLSWYPLKLDHEVVGFESERIYFGYFELDRQRKIFQVFTSFVIPFYSIFETFKDYYRYIPRRNTVAIVTHFKPEPIFWGKCLNARLESLKRFFTSYSKLKYFDIAFNFYYLGDTVFELNFFEGITCLQLCLNNYSFPPIANINNDLELCIKKMSNLKKLILNEISLPNLKLHSTTITELRLYYQLIHQRIKPFLNLSNLKKLYLANIKLEFSFLSNLPKLEYLYTQNIVQLDQSCIIDILLLPQLKHVYFKDCGFPHKIGRLRSISQHCKLLSITFDWGLHSFYCPNNDNNILNILSLDCLKDFIIILRNRGDQIISRRNICTKGNKFFYRYIYNRKNGFWPWISFFIKSCFFRNWR